MAYNVMLKKKGNRENAVAYFNPLIKENQIHAVTLPYSLGNYVVLNGTRRVDFNLANSDWYFLYMSTSAGVAFYQIDPGNRTLVPYVVTAINNQPPESVRQSRACLALQNVTNELNRAGSVTVLTTSNPLDWEFDTAVTTGVTVSANFLTELQTMTDTNPSARNFTAHDFAHIKTFIVAPASYQGFSQWDVYTDLTPLTTQSRWAYYSDQAAKMRQNTIIIRLRNPGATSQTYNLIGTLQYCGRYPSNDILSTIQQKQTSITQNKFNNMVDHAQEHGSQPVELIS